MRKTIQTRVKAVLLLIFIAFSLLFIGSCVYVQVPSSEHVHDYGNKWSYNKTEHWRECTCTATMDKQKHDFTWRTVKDGTCDTPAEEEGICICGYKTLRQGEKKEHTLITHAAKEPTCTEIGWEAYESCANCSYSTKQEIGKKEHTYSEAWVKTEARHWHACSVCGEKKGVADHEFSWEVQIAGTCQTAATEEGTCVCGYKAFREGEKAEHTVITHAAKAATCTESGWGAYETCAKCSYSTKTVIGAKGHSYSTTWSKTDARHWHVCGFCGDKKDLGDHTYDAGLINGLRKTRTCSACLYEKETSVVDGIKETLYSNTSENVALDDGRSYMISATKLESGVLIYAEGVFNSVVSTQTAWSDNTHFEFRLNNGTQIYVTAKQQSQGVTEFTYAVEQSNGKYIHTVEIFVEKSLINGWTEDGDVQLNYGWKTPGERAYLKSDLLDYRYYEMNSEWHSYQRLGGLDATYISMPANLFITVNGLKALSEEGVDGIISANEYPAKSLSKENANMQVKLQGKVFEGGLYLAFTVRHSTWSSYTNAAGSWQSNDHIEFSLNGQQTAVMFFDGQMILPAYFTAGAAVTTQASGGQLTTVVELYVAGNQDTYSLQIRMNSAGTSFGELNLAWGVSTAMVTDQGVSNTMLLNVMSFNIRADWDSGIKAWSSRKDALIASVKAHGASVICFQEVRKTQYEGLVAGLGDAYEVVYYARESKSSNPEGLAIAYKKDVWNKLSQSVFWLSDTPNVESASWDDSYNRICVNVLLEHKETGAKLDVYSVHLGLTETSRTKGIQMIMDRAAQNGYPTYMAGDFNCYYGTAPYLLAAEKYQDCMQTAKETDSGITSNSWGATADNGTDAYKKCIDFCFVSKEGMSPLSFAICRDKWGENNENYLSDHYAVKSTILWSYE